MAITRTPLGVSQSKTNQASWSALHNVQVCAGQTLLVGAAYDNASLVGVSFGTQPLTFAASALNANGVELGLWHLLSTPTSAVSGINLTWGGNVTAKAMFAVAVQGVNTLDTLRTAVSNAVGAVSTGSATATRTANAFLLAFAGEEGANSANPVSWLQDITTSGLVQGTSGGGAATNITLHQGEAILTTIGTRSAKLSSFTTADAAILLAVYVQLDTPAPDPVTAVWSLPTPALRSTRQRLTPSPLGLSASLPPPAVTNVAGGGDASALLTDLVAYWTLDESSGTRVDATGRGNDLAASGSPGATTGVVGQAATFNGSAQYLSHASTSDLQAGDVDFALAGWMRVDTFGAYNFVLAKAGTAANIVEWYLLCHNESGQQQLHFVVIATAYGPETIVTALVTIPEDTWVFVVAWHDATANTINLQINDGTVYSQAHSTGVVAETEAFALGRTLRTTDFPLVGALDEVGLWKRVLTADERTALYNGGAGLTYPFGGGGPSTQTVSPSPVAATLSPIPPALARGGVRLGPSVLPLTASLSTPQVSRVGAATQTLTPSAVPGSLALATPALQRRRPLTPTPLTLAGSLLTPACQATRRLLPSPLSLTGGLPAPILAAAQRLDASAVSATWSLTTPQVRAAPRTLAPSPVGLTVQLTTARVGGAQTLEPDAAAATWQPASPGLTGVGGGQPTPLLARFMLPSAALVARHALAVSAITLSGQVPSPQIRQVRRQTPTAVALTAASSPPVRQTGSRVLTPEAVGLTASLATPQTGGAQTLQPSPLALTAGLASPSRQARRRLAVTPLAASLSLTAVARGIGARQLAPTPALAAWTTPASLIALGGVVVTPDPLALEAIPEVPVVAALGAPRLTPEAVRGLWVVPPVVVQCWRLTPAPVTLTWRAPAPVVPGPAPAALRGLDLGVAGALLVEAPVTTTLLAALAVSTQPHVALEVSTRTVTVG